MIKGVDNFDTIEEADKYFTDLGFNKHPSSKPDVVCQYSKKFYDGNSEKYFVHVNLWDFSNWVWGHYSAEYSGQFYKKGNHKAFNITFIDWDYENVVEFIENMFAFGLLENYDEDNV